jgi:hypothetical protein
MSLRVRYLGVPNNIFDQNFSDPYINATQRITVMGDTIFTLPTLKTIYYE